MAFAHGYTMAYKFNLDGLGVTYISLAAAWTLILLLGSAVLIKNRDLPFLRIRNIPLALGAVALLHVYWILCMISYVLNGFFPCATEFWIMSVYLPLGIALYHASNAQLLHVAGLQKKYTTPQKLPCCEGKSVHLQPLWVKKIKAMITSSSPKNTMTAIGIGMVIQFIGALIIFLVSNKFHPGFGLIGHEVSMSVCRKGWEWLPSIVWQFFWAWIYAPYLLWKVRGIKDVHGWRAQTVFCCLAGLPASPMWLISLYVDKMEAVRKYFVSPLWFTPSILLMQACVVLMPCIQIYRNQKLQSETRQIIAEWEKKIEQGDASPSESTTIRSNSKESYNSSAASTAFSQRAEMYTMGTLEKTLQLNSTPLLLFAALKDFSGENISFLKNLNDWQKNWEGTVSRKTICHRLGANPKDEAVLRRQQFNHAVEIYSSFVSLQYSDFPINLSSAHFKELEALFDKPASLVSENTPDNAVSPFNSFRASTRLDDVEKCGGKDITVTVSSVKSNNSNDTFPFTEDNGHSSQLTDFSVPRIRDKLPGDIPVPASFGPGTFDKAERSIKELVLTNTWPKFVNAGFANSTEKISIRDYVGLKIEYIKQHLPQFPRKRSMIL